MFKGALLLLLLAAAPASAQSASEGILLLAHGGAADWNARVNALAATLDATQPVEVAFGMASRPSIQSAIDRLVARGATSVVAVPLFISSHSSVVTSTAYLLGLRSEMPPDLKIFAKMNHGSHGATTATATNEHEGHAATVDEGLDNLKPVASPSPIRMTDALNRHELVGEILIERAREISTVPEQEAVIVVAHGPVPDEDNQKWLADMKVLVDQMDASTAFATIDYLTVRDDAPKPVRDAATEELRTLVTTHERAGRRVLIVPLLLSYGGIEKGIRQRLEGLNYVMATRALMPDSRLADWVRQAVAK
jgi:sirohydrochlorin cobaltochelatase